MNASITYNSFNGVKLETSDAHNKCLLYSQFVAWYRKESSIAPLSQYTHNPVYQNLSKLNEFFKNAQKKYLLI